MLASWASACGPDEADSIGSDSDTSGPNDEVDDDAESTDDDTTGDGTTDDGSEHGLDSDVFHVDEVYLAGAVTDEFASEDPCVPFVLAHWSAPHVAASGFDCHFDPSSAVIRPSDGRLLYAHHFSSQILEFHCDTCPLFSEWDYPWDIDTLVNDTPLLSECVHEFLLAPSGSYVYRCYTSWYDQFGELVYEEQEGPLFHLDDDGFAMTTSSVIELGSGTVMPIEGFPLDNVPPGGFTQRTDPEGGFFVVGGSSDLPKLWHVERDGSSTELGIYPPLPPDLGGHPRMALDGNQVLFQLGYADDYFNDVILRRELEGTSEVVYAESSDPLVKVFHYAALVTGP